MLRNHASYLVQHRPSLARSARTLSLAPRSSKDACYASRVTRSPFTTLGRSRLLVVQIVWDTRHGQGPRRTTPPKLSPLKPLLTISTAAETRYVAHISHHHGFSHHLAMIAYKAIGLWHGGSITLKIYLTMSQLATVSADYQLASDSGEDIAGGTEILSQELRGSSPCS